MKRKVIILLVAVLALSALVACSPKESEVTTTEETTTSKETVATEEITSKVTPVTREIGSEAKTKSVSNGTTTAETEYIEEESEVEYVQGESEDYYEDVYYEQPVYEETEQVAKEEIELLSDESDSNYGFSDYEIWLIEQVVQVETGGSYMGSYYETATILNRLNTGWGSSIEEVCYQPDQYPACTYGWLDNEISEETRQAVLDCIANNNTPSNLVYADSRHNYDGTEAMTYYCSYDGQDFYLSN